MRKRIMITVAFLALFLLGLYLHGDAYAWEVTCPYFTTADGWWTGFAVYGESAPCVQAIVRDVNGVEVETFTYSGSGFNSIDMACPVAPGVEMVGSVLFSSDCPFIVTRVMGNGAGFAVTEWEAR